uniref:Putative secreted protein n=1 Tax=Ixodes ricinus TaxID=34613 RepID=A0A6B0TX16_IXORI
MKKKKKKKKKNWRLSFVIFVLEGSIYKAAAFSREICLGEKYSFLLCTVSITEFSSLGHTISLLVKDIF